MFMKVYATVTKNPKASPITKANAAMDLAQVSAILDGDDDVEHAVRLFEEAIEGYKTGETGDTLPSIAAQVKLADLCRRSGNFERARDLPENCFERYGTFINQDIRAYELEAYTTFLISN